MLYGPHLLLLRVLSSVVCLRMSPRFLRFFAFPVPVRTPVEEAVDWI